jgi:mannose/fructose/N-acetylgalactosamine-specific phosphotransferase system component IIB
MPKRKLLPPFPEEYPHLLDEWDFEKNKDIDPNSLSVGSTKKVWWRCKKNPKHEWNATIYNRAKKTKGCPYCSGFKTHPDDSLATLYPNLLEEWHPTRNEGLNPYQVSPKGVRRVWWQCKVNPNHVWDTFVRSRTETDTGCPECARENLEKNLSVAALYPEIADEWNYEKNSKSPKDYTSKSGETVWWICKDCMNEWRAEIKNRTLLNSKCPICSRDNQIITYKKNKLENGENEIDYSFEVEEKLFLQYKEIQQIFRYMLKIESWDKTIDALLSPRIINKIDYDPYYQRRYVWDNVKATYFIESILIGTEIPPLIVFETNNKMEVIDGRQRFETIMRFHRNDFSLNKNGLNLLKFLERKSFDELEEKLKELFIDTRIRIIKFSLVDESRIEDKSIDMLKKEIFRRYNSGITPLKRVEIEKAIYINDEPTKYFKQHIQKNKNLFLNITSLFSAETDLYKLDKKVTLEKLLQEIRFLLICTKMPITSTRQKELFEVYYNRFSEEITDTPSLFKAFVQKVKYLLQIKTYFESNDIKLTRYAFETLFWAISILESEKIDISELFDEKSLNELVLFFNENSATFLDDSSQFLYSQFMTRYNTISEYFGEKYKINFDIYISSNPSFRKKIKEYKESTIDFSFDNFDNLRIDKPEPIPHTIDDICRMMLRGKFLVRPVYQRGEVINKVKSSAIIESILLGIKLPPMFIFQREDGIFEVIDGQQRILSILGFMDQEFIDEKGNRVKSEKTGYNLTKLKILNNLNGLTFDELDEELKDSIYDFPLSFIMIDSKHNPEFDPVDLFIRLNNRPYPIKENSFEMWNSYVDKDIIDGIKGLVNKYDSWFYYRQRKNDNRMKNEELYTIFAYMEYKYEFSDFDPDKFYPFLDIHHKSTGLYIRVKSKLDITKILNTATIDSKEKQNFDRSIRAADNLLKRLKMILIENDEINEDEYLASELTRIFNVKKQKWYSRTLQDFYTLWYLIHFINQERIIRDRNNIKQDLFSLFETIKNVQSREENPNQITEFHETISKYKTKYKKVARKLTLSKEEVEQLLKLQNNICPICNNKLLINDEIHIDHKIPLAQGGKDRFLNLQAVHKYCNLKKGSKK